MKQNLRLARTTRRAYARYEMAMIARIEAACAIRFDQEAFTVAAARVAETYRLYDALEARLTAALAMSADNVHCLVVSQSSRLMDIIFAVNA